jgi:precorrin-2/cobalt-factor-2 C20-methyltransferase
MSTPGEFGGVGVGPGEQGLIPVVAWEFVKRCDVIFVPRAKTMEHSVARQCLPANDIPDERFREVEFTMDSDRNVLREHYAKLAQTIATELRAGKDVAYLTIGDPLTYSTYIYTLAALKDCMPELRYRTFPGVTSYCALASAAEFPLGEGKERVLILPCPDAMPELRATIEVNDLVVLMKIGERLPNVLGLLREMGIDGHCAFGRHVGMSDQIVFKGLRELQSESSLGYLSTMLIRKTPAQKRHSGGQNL